MSPFSLSVAKGWSSWNAWSSCSVTCGVGGVRKRERVCSSPPDCHLSCIGLLAETEPCPNVKTCPGRARLPSPCPSFSYCKFLIFLVHLSITFPVLVFQSMVPGLPGLPGLGVLVPVLIMTSFHTNYVSAPVRAPPPPQTPNHLVTVAVGAIPRCQAAQSFPTVQVKTCTL